jgi:hypothetical protein
LSQRAGEACLALMSIVAQAEAKAGQ